jgi:tetratricopeptide (TPR) repeat protein
MGVIVRTSLLCTGLWMVIASPARADDGFGPVDLDEPSAPASAPVEDSVALHNSANRAAIAMQHYEADKWPQARAAFVRAYELYPHPQYLFYIADTHRREGSFRVALMYYHRFLESSQSPDSWLRSEAEEYADQLHRAIGQRARRMNKEELRRSAAVRTGAPPIAHVDPTVAPVPTLSSDDGVDPRRNTKLAFAVSGVLTASSVVFWGYSGSRVLHFEDEKDQALIDAAQSGVSFDPADACADAESQTSAAAARVDDACSSGQRWAIMTNAALATTVIGIAVTSYFGYKAYIATGDDDRRAVVQIAPTAGPDGVGVTGLLTF